MDLHGKQIFTITKTYFGMRFRIKEGHFTAELCFPDHIINEAVDRGRLVDLWVDVLSQLLQAVDRKSQGDYWR